MTNKALLKVTGNNETSTKQDNGAVTAASTTAASTNPGAEHSNKKPARMQSPTAKNQPPRRSAGVEPPPSRSSRTIRNPKGVQKSNAFPLSLNHRKEGQHDAPLLGCNENADSAERHRQTVKRLSSYLKFVEKTPDIALEMMDEIRELRDKQFGKWAERLYKTIERNRKFSFWIRGSIGKECYERDERLKKEGGQGLKSKGGRGSKGTGLQVELEKTAAAIGIEPSTLRDDVRIYETFVCALLVNCEDQETLRAERREFILKSIVRTVF